MNETSLGEYAFNVRSYECGAKGIATMATICNYLQEAASLHADELGFSKGDFAALGENISWVLTRLKIRMKRFPLWKERVKVLTFPRGGGRKITALRDFEIFIDDERIGAATSEWVIIDLNTRRLATIPQVVYDRANHECQPVLGDDAFARVRWSKEDTQPSPLTFQTGRRDIDLNGHVNNVHYVEWLFETLPEITSGGTELEIAFKTETFCGERIITEAVTHEPNVWVAHVANPDGHDHVVARLNIDTNSTK